MGECLISRRGGTNDEDLWYQVVVIPSETTRMTIPDEIDINETFIIYRYPAYSNYVDQQGLVSALIVNGEVHTVIKASSDYKFQITTKGGDPDVGKDLIFYPETREVIYPAGSTTSSSIGLGINTKRYAILGKKA